MLAHIAKLLRTAKTWNMFSLFLKLAVVHLSEEFGGFFKASAMENQ